MKWFDYKKFKHYELLEQLRDAVILEYSTWKDNHDHVSEGINVKERYNITEEDPEHLRNLVWYGFPLVTGRVVAEEYTSSWPKTLEAIKKIPGVINVAINFVGPHNIIPDHKDDYFDMSTDIIGEKKGWGTMIGISMPSKDPEVVGFHIDGEKKGWETGDIVSFDGYKTHGGWNNSNEWRVTMIIDTEQEYWEL